VDERGCTLESLEMRTVFSGFFNNKRIVITGHTGFKGSWLCHVLSWLGAEVHGLALQPESMSHFNVAETETLIQHNLVDINDAAAIISAIKDLDPQLIIHLAAQPLVRLSYDDPLATLQTNIMGSANVMQAALLCERKPVVAMITSDKCYENKERDAGYSETEPMGGHDPYSASKGAAELVIQAFARSFFQPNQQSLLSLRGGNVIGGGDWAKDRIMTDIVNGLKDAKVPELRNPSATRPWQHVLDVINGYLSAILYVANQSAGTFESFNIGPMQENVANVGTLANKACQLWGGGIVPKVAVNVDQPHEARLLQLNISKALAMLDWKPKYDLDASLAQTISWYRAFQDGRAMPEFTLSQIEDFFVAEG
jgi:CDP-glucose 4,6-dehydratase